MSVVCVDVRILFEAQITRSLWRGRPCALGRREEQRPELEMDRAMPRHLSVDRCIRTHKYIHMFKHVFVYVCMCSSMCRFTFLFTYFIDSCDPEAPVGACFGAFRAYGGPVGGLLRSMWVFGVGDVSFRGGSY